MWTAIGTAVLKGVVEHVLAPDNSNNSGGSSNYKPNPPQNAYHQNQHQFYSHPQTSPRHHQGPTACSNCHNCSKSSSKPRNKNSFSRHQKNEGPFCTIKVPKNSDLEIKIKKTQSQMANMNIKVQNSAQKAGSNNFNSQKQKSSTFNKEKLLKSNKTNNTGDNKKFNAKPKNYQKSEATNTGNTWMYLGRLKIGTTEGDIHCYLSEKFPRRKFKVESLPLYKDGKLPCFKVLVDNSILAEFEDLSHWPQGIKVTKYRHNFKN